MAAKRQWVLVTALLCLAILALGFMFLVKPQHKKASDVKAQTADVQTQVTQLRSKLATLTQEKKDIVGEQAKLAQYVQQLPKDPQEPTLLRSVQQAATDAKVDLTTLNPSAPAAFTPTATTAGTTAASATDTSGLQVIKMQMAVSGSYFELENFLDSLEGLQRSMLVDTFTIAGGASSSSASPSAAEITANIQAEVFTSSTIGAGATAAPAS